MSLLRRLAVALAGLLLAAQAAVAAEPAKQPDAPAKISYYRDIRPIFHLNCQGCHQPAKAGGNYVMINHADLLKAGDRELPGVVPGKPEKSLMVELVTPSNGKADMPKGKDPLPEFQLKLINRWIAEGAIDDTPASVKADTIDEDHPPDYAQPPVLTALDYSPDGSLLAVSGYHEVLLHKADGSGLVGRLVGLSERVQSLAFSPDGKFLAVSGGNPGRFGEVQIWNVEKRELKLSVPVTFDTVYGVSWSPDGGKVAFGCADNTLRAIDALTGKQILFQGAHSDWVRGTVFSTDGLHLVSISRDRSMKLTEVATQRFVDNVTSITPGALKGGLSAVARRPLATKTMVKVPPDNAEKLYDELLIGGSDGIPRLYKMHRVTKRVIGDDANKIREYEKMPGRIFAVCFSADGNQFAAGSSLDGTGEVRVYQTADGKKVSTFAGKMGGVYALAYRKDGKAVASAGFDGLVRLHDPASGKLLKEFSPLPPKAAAVGKGK